MSKENPYIGLQKLLNWISAKNLDRDSLEKILIDYNITNSVIPKLLICLIGSPQVLIKVNKYINTLNINSLPLIDIIFFIGQLCLEHQITHKDLIQQKINFERINKLSSLRNYLESITSTNVSKQELEFFYILSTLLNESFIFLEKEIIRKEQPSIQNKINSLNSEIVNFSKSIKEEKLNREKCKKCPLYNNPIVTFDTNSTLNEQLDVIFIGLNPGKDEIKQDKPFVGRAGKIFRENLNTINCKWLITNIILCHTKNETELRKLDDPINIANNCNELVMKIVNSFSSKLIVPIGKVAAQTLGLNNPTNGVIYSLDKYPNIQILPILHPSSLLYGKNEKRIAEFKSNIEKLKQTIENNKQQNVEIEKIEQSNEENQIFNCSRLTLFNICELSSSNKILYIYLDEEGNKHYRIEKPKFKVLINNSEWSKLSTLSSTIHQSVDVSLIDKNLIQKAAKQKIILKM